MKKIVGISGHLGSGKDTAADRLVAKFGFQKVALADPIKRYGLNVFHFTEEQLWGPSDARNAMDERFQCYSEEDSDDAWEAAFSRATKYNRKFVRELFPDSVLLQGEAFSALEAWLRELATTHPQISARIVLQSLGTEWGRKVKDDVWIRAAIRTSTSLLAGGFVYDPSTGLLESKVSKGPAGVVISDVRFSNELEHIKHSSGFLIRVYRPESDASATQVGIENHKSETEQLSFEDSQFNYVICNDGSLEEFLEKIDVAGFILTGSDTVPTLG